MSVYKRGSIWWYKFVWRGEPIRDTTKQGNKRVAQQIEAARKVALAKGEVGLVDTRPVPTFDEFTKRFLEWAAVEKRPNTVKYYNDMVRILLRFPLLARAKLTAIDKELIAAYAEHRRKAKRTGVRRTGHGQITHTVIDKPITLTAISHEIGTIRRILNIAVEWGVLEDVPKIKTGSNTRQLERILSDDEEQQYLAMSPQPLRDFATLSLDTGMRPSEILKLRWEFVVFRPATDEQGSFVQIVMGKTRNARRRIYLTDRVIDVLCRRCQQAGNPAEGWVFPGTDPDGCYSYAALDSQHDRTVQKMAPHGCSGFTTCATPHSLDSTNPVLTAFRCRGSPATLTFARHLGTSIRLLSTFKLRLSALRHITPRGRD